MSAFLASLVVAPAIGVNPRQDGGYARFIKAGVGVEVEAGKRAVRDDEGRIVVESPVIAGFAERIGIVAGGDNYGNGRDFLALIAVKLPHCRQDFFTRGLRAVWWDDCHGYWS